jgi:hypothetical protein
MASGSVLDSPCLKKADSDFSGSLLLPLTKSVPVASMADNIIHAGEQVPNTNVRTTAALLVMIGQLPGNRCLPPQCNAVSL